MISVIVPIYYGKKYIEKMIKQIEVSAANIKDPVELLLVNDSPDEPLSEYMSKTITITVINKGVNQGIHGARVSGLENADGEYILFLDQDDKIDPLYFVRQIEKCEGYDAVVCYLMHCDKVGYPNEEKLSGTINLDYLISKGNPIFSPGQVLIKKASIPNIWKEKIMKYNGADDWLLWISMLKTGCRFSCNQDMLYEHIVHSDNASMDFLSMWRSMNEVLEILEKNNILSNIENDKLKVFLNKHNEDVLVSYRKCLKKAYLYDRWLDLHIRNKYIGDFCIDKKIKSVSIYGAGEIGNRIYKELISQGIKVDSFIDQNAQSIKRDIPVVALEMYDKKSEIIIVSLIENQNNVKSQLIKKLQVDIYSIGEIISLL